jgi:circadian clock protein KaiC
MLRYQQQFPFYVEAKIPSCVRYLHFRTELLEHGLEEVLKSILAEIEATNPKLVFVDSFRSIVRKSEEPGQMELQSFVQRLALHLTSWEATTFLIGEYE